jgi:hypothetical protein
LPNPPDFEPAVCTYLAQAALSVHLLSPYITPVTTPATTQEQIYRQLNMVRTRDQIDLANQCSQERRDFSRILWMPPDSGSLGTDEFWQALQNEPDFISTNLEALKDIIHDRIMRPPAPMPDLSLDGIVQVYLDCDERDLETPGIEPLYEWLEQNFRVVLPDYEDSNVTRSEAMIKQCEAVLIYYGEASGLWLKRRLLALKKTLYGRSMPLRAKAVYAANPAKQCLSDSDVPVIEGFGKFQPDLLNVFLEQLA